MENNKLSYEKMKNFLVKNIILIAVSMVCLTYVITGFVKINESGKSFLEIIGESVLVFLFSYFIIQSFSLQGLLNGEESKEVIIAKNNHNQIKEKIGINVSKLSRWINKKNIEAEKEIKNEALCDYGITYQELMNDEFNKDKLTKLDLKRLNKIKLKKVSKLLASEVLNENTKKNNPLYLGKNKKNFLTERNFLTLTTKIIFTLLFGYFSTSFIGLNIADLIWKLIQVVLFLIFGVMEYYRSYLYMVGEYSEMLRRKTMLLNEFLDYLNKGEVLDEKLF